MRRLRFRTFWIDTDLMHFDRTTYDKEILKAFFAANPERLPYYEKERGHAK